MFILNISKRWLFSAWRILTNTMPYINFIKCVLGLSGMTPSRYMRRGVGGSSGFSNIWSTNSGAGRDTSSKNVIRRGRQLLDQEGLTCLLGKIVFLY